MYFNILKHLRKRIRSRRLWVLVQSDGSCAPAVRDDEASYEGRFPIMRPINHAWISRNKLSEKMGAL